MILIMAKRLMIKKIIAKTVNFRSSILNPPCQLNGHQLSDPVFLWLHHTADAESDGHGETTALSEVLRPACLGSLMIPMNP